MKTLAGVLSELSFAKRAACGESFFRSASHDVDAIAAVIFRIRLVAQVALIANIHASDLSHEPRVRRMKLNPDDDHFLYLVPLQHPAPTGT